MLMSYEYIKPLINEQRHNTSTALVNDCVEPSDYSIHVYAVSDDSLAEYQYDIWGQWRYEDLQDRVSTNVQFYLRFSVILVEFRQIVLRLHQNARMFMQVATYTQRSQRVQHMHCISAEQYVWTYSMLMRIENVT